jgi:nicotinamide riboside transporter PnuC
MTDVFGWIGSLLGVIGALLNARRNRIGFMFYIAANVILVAVGYYKNELYNVVLFAVFLAIACYGYVEWGKNTKSSKGAGG